ncbi:MAG: hypothetical protein IJ583_04470 [Firmicutes bacterium]|nr:hypothetical protein [Bacillota bacterium]
MHKLRVAQLNVEIDYKYETMTKQSEAYKCDFEKPDIVVSASDEAIEKMHEEYPHLSLNDCEYMLTGFIFYNKLLQYDGFMLHSSTVVLNNEAYMFSAPSGTGKSTHTQLWLKEFGDKAYILNDDKPAIRFFNDGIYAYGTPWSGKTDQNVNKKVPVKAIIFIERSENNHIEKMGATETLKMLLYQGFRSRGKTGTENFLDMSEKIVNKIGVYKLGCNISREAVLTVYNEINGGKLK